MYEQEGIVPWLLMPNYFPKVAAAVLSILLFMRAMLSNANVFVLDEAGKLSLRILRPRWLKSREEVHRLSR